MLWPLSRPIDCQSFAVIVTTPAAWTMNQAVASSLGLRKSVAFVVGSHIHMDLPSARAIQLLGVRGPLG